MQTLDADLARILEEGESSAWWIRQSGEIQERTHRPLRRARIPRESALVGREAEVEELRALWGRVKSGAGRALLLEGEAGIGKSRLVDEFATILDREGEDFDYLFGSYPPGGAATASRAFSTAFREHLGATHLEEALVSRLTATPSLVPAFAALLAGRSSLTGVEPLTRESVQTVFVHLARALARERPILVLIDDLHFASEEGRSLFAAMAHALAGHRVLLIGTARPGLPEDWSAALARLPHVTRLTLRRLVDEEVVELLREALQSARLAETLKPLVAEKAEGNPFFVFELLRGLREERLIVRTSDGAWCARSTIREVRIPSSVRALVMARLSRLDEAAVVFWL